MTKQKEKKKASIVKKMMIAVVAGFVVGFICLLIKSAVMGTDGEGAGKLLRQFYSRISPQQKILKDSACSTS